MATHGRDLETKLFRSIAVTSGERDGQREFKLFQLMIPVEWMHPVGLKALSLEMTDVGFRDLVREAAGRSGIGHYRLSSHSDTITRWMESLIAQAASERPFISASGSAVASSMGSAPRRSRSSSCRHSSSNTSTLSSLVSSEGSGSW